MIHKHNTACMNRPPRAEGYSVLTRKYVASGEYHFEPEWIENRMSTKCRSDMDVYKLGPCKGCTLEQDIEYLIEKGLMK